MHIIKANSPTDAWLQSHQYLLENGNKDVMNESINMSVEIENNFDTDDEEEGPNHILLWMDYNINRMIHLLNGIKHIGVE
jgi:hypothetical protein